MQSRPLYLKFSRVYSRALWRRLFAANSRDLLLDFSLTYLSVIFNYAGPFFLKKILDALDPKKHPTAEERALAFVWAILAFLSTLCKVRLCDFIMRNGPL